jgi:hypothetical protein
MWQAYTNLQTSNLSRLDTALEEKVKRNLPIGGMDIPSLERSIGSALPQATIQGGIAVATGGASIPIQMAVTASVNGGMAFGATYSQTNDTWKAGEEAIWTAGQTAMIPISSKLPGVANTSFDLATGYVVGKMRGQSDAQILDSMLTQGILGAGFKAGTKFSELSPAMKQKAMDIYKTVAKESQKAVDGIYNQAKAKFNAQNPKIQELQSQAAQLKAEIQNKLGTNEAGVTINGQKINIPKKNSLQQNELYKVADVGEFRQKYASELLSNPKLRERVNQIETTKDVKAKRLALDEVEADVLLNRLDANKLSQIKKEVATIRPLQTYKSGNVFEILATNPTKAKSEVDGVVTKLAKDNPKIYGKPDNVQIDKNGKIIEIEEIKYFNVDKLELLANKAKTDPQNFVDWGLGVKNKPDSLIQFGKHKATLEAIKTDSTKINGTSIKGVADDVKYVLKLPKFEGNDFLKVNQAVKEMQKAWKDKLGIDVEIKFVEHSTKDIDLMVKVLQRNSKIK